MAARAAVHTLLSEDPVIVGLGFGKVYASNSIDSPEEHKFLVVRWSESAASFGTHGPEGLSVWAHTKDRDYGEVDLVLERVKLLLSEAVHLEGGDGWALTTAVWTDDSSDLRDGGFDTLTRNTSFTVASRYTAS